MALSSNQRIPKQDPLQVCVQINMMCDGHKIQVLGSYSRSHSSKATWFISESKLHLVPRLLSTWLFCPPPELTVSKIINHLRQNMKTLIKEDSKDARVMY